MRRFLPALIVLFLLVLQLSPVARSGVEEPLRGPVFSDPAVIQPVDAGWEKKPVAHVSDQAGADLVVDLNQQLYPFLLPFVEQYGREHGLKIEVTEGTCGKSAGKLARKEIDLGGFCCPPGEVDRLPGLRYHTLGISPLAILVDPANPVDSLSLEQVRRVFRGEIGNWSELGGPDLLIKPIASLHCKVRPGHWRLLLDNEDLFGPRFMEVGDMAEQINLLSSTPGAIGYETLWVAERFRHKGMVKALLLDGMNPLEIDHLRKNAYPVYRVYNITTWEGEGVASPHGRNLAAYLLEQAAQLDPRAGMVPAAQLRQAGWKFSNDELVGEPD